MKLDPTTITVLPERQREDLGDLSELAASIRQLGLINPITVTLGDAGRPILIAGERRLRAWMEARPEQDIPCVLFEDLGPFDQRLIELEENIKRKDLTWQERALAIAGLDEMHRQQNPDWSYKRTAEICSLSSESVRRAVAVVESFADSRIKAAPTLSAALAIVDRKVQHAIDRESSKLGGILEAALAPATAEPGEAPAPGMAPQPTSEAIQSPPEPQFSVVNEDFHEWAAQYSGEPFTFIHCDFPYGMNYHESDQAHAASGSYSAYDDDPEVFDKLFTVLLEEQIARLISPCAHMIFWHKASQTYKIAQRILALDRGWRVFLVPLIWFRSDNRGIAADVNRQPRHVYETALLCSRGDRRIFKLVSDVKDSPTSHNTHPSHKPEVVLKHFFQMTIDEHTTVLDPTCGSGSALTAALALGARRIVGIEKNPEYADIALTALRRAANLRDAAALLEEAP